MSVREPTSTSDVAWPRVGGVSLILIGILDGRAGHDSLATIASEDLAIAAKRHDVAIEPDIAKFEPAVQPGARRVLNCPDFSSPVAVRCPADFSVCEASPIVDFSSQSPAIRERIRAFWRDASQAAFRRFDRLAVVVAHDWTIEDRVHFRSGSEGEFMAYAEAFDAWTVPYVGTGGKYVVNLDTESVVWFEVQSSRV